jgi:hypothetical protein
MKPWLVFLLLLSFGAVQSRAQRSIPDDNLAYPVLIDLSDCRNNIASVKGSGFFLNTGPEEYLVTARHILFDLSQRVQPNQPLSLLCKKANLVSYSKDPKERQQNRFELDLQLLNTTSKIKAHATKDIAIVQIGVNPQPTALVPIAGVQANAIAPSGILSAILETNVKKFTEVLTGNDVHVLGYPSSIGIQQSPQIDYNSPLLRKGIVAGTNVSNKTIVLDCLTFFGNSGGPVLQAVPVGLGTRFDVIGIISQYIPFAETWVNTTLNYSNVQVYNSGYSIAEPMDSVFELLGK